MSREKKNNITINGLFFVAYKVLNVLFPLVTSVYVARVLLPSGTGRVAYAQNIVTYFTLLAALGLPTYGTREIARTLGDDEEYNKTFFELFSVNAISTTLCVIVYYTLCFTVPTFRKDLDLYLVAGLAIVLNYINIDWLYQGREEYKYIAIRGVLVKATSVALLFILVKNPSDYVAYAGIYCLVLGGNNFANSIGLRHRIKFRKYHLNLKKHMKPIIILFATTIAIELYTMLDTTMLGVLSTNEIVGYYSYAMKTSKIIITVLAAATTVLLPRLSNYYKTSKNKYEELANKGVSFLFAVSIPITIFLLFNANDVVLFLYGEHYFGAINTLKILSLLIVPIAFSTYFGVQILCSANMEKYMLISVCIGACTNIFMNAMLIPKYYQNGAAIASVASEFIVMMCDAFFVRRVIKICITKKLIVTTLCTSFITAIASVALHGLLNSMFLQLFFAGTIMVLLVVITLSKSLLTLRRRREQ